MQEDKLSQSSIYVTFDKCAVLQQTYLRRSVAVETVCRKWSKAFLVDWEESDKISMYKGYICAWTDTECISLWLFIGSPERGWYFTTKKTESPAHCSGNQDANLSTLFDNCFTFTSGGLVQGEDKYCSYSSFLSTSGSLTCKHFSHHCQVFLSLVMNHFLCPYRSH